MEDQPRSAAACADELRERTKDGTPVDTVLAEHPELALGLPLIQDSQPAVGPGSLGGGSYTDATELSGF